MPLYTPFPWEQYIRIAKEELQLLENNMLAENFDQLKKQYADLLSLFMAAFYKELNWLYQTREGKQIILTKLNNVIEELTFNTNFAGFKQECLEKKQQLESQLAEENKKIYLLQNFKKVLEAFKNRWEVLCKAEFNINPALKTTNIYDLQIWLLKREFEIKITNSEQKLINTCHEINNLKENWKKQLIDFEIYIAEIKESIDYEAVDIVGLSNPADVDAVFNWRLREINLYNIKSNMANNALLKLANFEKELPVLPLITTAKSAPPTSPKPPHIS